MRNFFSRFRYSFYRFMQGRYGTDDLNKFLIYASIVLMILSWFKYLRVLYFAALILLVLSLLRTFSKNHFKRRMELNRYYKIKNFVKKHFNLAKSKFRDRKTHKYYSCPHCHAVNRIPKQSHGKTITIHCPGCNKSFDKRT